MSISAHGGGLVNGIAGIENKFTVFTSGKPVSGLTVAFEGKKIFSHFIQVHLGLNISLSEICFSQFLEINFFSFFPGPTKPDINFNSNKDGSVDVAYIPKAGGMYRIHIKYENKEIIGSPFKCNISGDDATHRKLTEKVQITGPNVSNGKVNADNELTINCKEAGITGGISFAMEGPAKVEVSFRNNNDSTITVIYKPPQAGDYKLHLKFNDIHLPGSPFPITVAWISKTKRNLFVWKSEWEKESEQLNIDPATKSLKTKNKTFTQKSQNDKHHTNQKDFQQNPHPKKIPKPEIVKKPKLGFPIEIVFHSNTQKLFQKKVSIKDSL